jgi:hypothetical protein
MKSCRCSGSLFSSKNLPLISTLGALTLLMFAGTIWAENRIASAEKFIATMSGTNEVPAVSTKANGYTSFRTASNDTVLKYKVNVTGLSDVTAAHIHQGKKGQNGEIIVDLLNNSKKNKIKLGIAIRGNLTGSDLIGPMKGNSTETLISAIRIGATYVDIHTPKYSDGEIRGQIELESGKNLNQSSAAKVNNVTSGT